MGTKGADPPGAPPAAPATRIQALARVVILDAALDIFSRHGFRGSTVDEIAARAGMSKANLLYYYRRKQDLYEAVLERTLTEWLQPLEALDVEGDPVEELRRYIGAKLVLSFERPEASRLFINEILAGAPVILPTLQTELRALVQEKASVIRQWVAEDGSRPSIPSTSSSRSGRPPSITPTSTCRSARSWGRRPGRPASARSRAGRPVDHPARRRAPLKRGSERVVGAVEIDEGRPLLAGADRDDAAEEDVVRARPCHRADLAVERDERPVDPGVPEACSVQEAAAKRSAAGVLPPNTRLRSACSPARTLTQTLPFSVTGR